MDELELVRQPCLFELDVGRSFHQRSSIRPALIQALHRVFICGRPGCPQGPFEYLQGFQLPVGTILCQMQDAGLDIMDSDVTAPRIINLFSFPFSPLNVLIQRGGVSKVHSLLRCRAAQILNMRSERFRSSVVYIAQGLNSDCSSGIASTMRTWQDASSSDLIDAVWSMTFFHVSWICTAMAGHSGECLKGIDAFIEVHEDLGIIYKDFEMKAMGRISIMTTLWATVILLAIERIATDVQKRDENSELNLEDSILTFCSQAASGKLIPEPWTLLKEAEYMTADRQYYSQRGMRGIESWTCPLRGAPFPLFIRVFSGMMPYTWILFFWNNWYLYMIFACTVVLWLTIDHFSHHCRFCHVIL